ncbi:MAG: extracellular solute-binding protein [Nitrososphaerota archaeon]
MSEEVMSEEKVSRRGYVKYAAAGIVVVAAAAGGAYYATRPKPTPTPTPKPTPTPIVTPTPTPTPKPTPTEIVVKGATPAERALNAVRQYIQIHKVPAGTKIVIAIPPPAKGHYDPKYYKEFLDACDGKVTIETVEFPIEQIRAKLTAEATAKTGAYDLFQIIPANWIADFAEMGLALKLDDYVKKYNPEFDIGPCPVIPPKMENENKYAGSWYASTVDYDVWFLHYRADILENPKEKEAFEDQYGYELKPPQTWDQVYDICEFFYRPKQGLWGWWSLKNPVWELIEYKLRLASRGVHYFDDDMRPLINSDPAIEALEDEVKIQKFQPPESYTGFWDQMYDFIIKGKVLATCSWTSLKKFAFGAGVGDKVKGALSPGYPTKDGRIRHSGMLALDNTLFLNAHSKHPELAYLFFQYYLDPAVSAKWVNDPAGWYEPFRVCHYDEPAIIETWGKEYIEVMRENAINWFVPDYTIPGCTRYDDALDKQVNAVLKGAADPEKAMNAVADEWEKITDEIGRSKLKGLWQTIKTKQYGLKLRELMDPNL